MRRLLCVTPAFPPNNAADCHRVRMALPYLRENGWEATVLAVEPSFVAGSKDPELESTVPKETEIRRVRAVPLGLTRMLGFGSLGLRAGCFLKREGDRLLKEGKFDAVYFSSTVFSTFPLGLRWKERYRTPFFVDYQDPWWSEYHRSREQRPPGGWLKYEWVQRRSKREEGRVLREAAGVTSVSPAYVEMLRRRYPEMDPSRFIELPFGAPDKDLEVAGGQVLSTRTEIWRYIGRGGPDMEAALRIFAAVLGGAKARPFRLELAGTSYATGSAAERTMAPVLEGNLPAGSVSESPGRIGFLESLRRLKGAHRLILFGSDDPQYTASKLYNYILAQRPLLVICREESSVARIVCETKSAELITFGENEIKMKIKIKIKIKEEWKEAVGRWLAMDPAKKPETDWQAFEPYTARSMTKKLCGFFEQALRC